MSYSSGSANAAHSESPQPEAHGFSSLIELAQGLPQVEKIVVNSFRSDASLLREIPAYLFSLGGKRIRPVLALLVGRMCGITTPTENLLNISAGIELIHLATLLHDDIIDKSPLRRRHRSAFVEFGLESSLLAGDFLLTRAFGLCARLDQTIIHATEEACVALTEGEILEVSLAKQISSVEQSLTIARKKTAALFNLACFAGSHVAGVSQEISQKLAVCGDHMGLAFQILDDILDVTADENLLGKKSGMDLIERKPSIINVLWLESGSPLAKRLTTPASEDESSFVNAALIELRGGKIVEHATKMALDAAAKSKTILQEVAALPEMQSRLDRQALAGLTAIIDLTVSRMS